MTSTTRYSYDGVINDTMPLMSRNIWYSKMGAETIPYRLAVPNKSILKPALPWPVRSMHTVRYNSLHIRMFEAIRPTSAGLKY